MNFTRWHCDGFLRKALSLALLGLLLAPALHADAQGGYNPPANAAAGSGEQPADESEARATAEPRKRMIYPISNRVSRYLAKALQMMQSDRFAEADEILERIADNRRLNATERSKIQQFLGNVAIYKTDPKDAMMHLAAALELGGLDLASDQQVTFQLASLYAQFEDYPKAGQTLDRWFADAVQPTSEAFYLKAVILIQMQQIEAAVVAAEQAVALTPNPNEAWLSLLAHTYYLSKNYPKMASTLETLIARVPTKKSYWMLLSAAYFELDRDVEAQSIVQLAYRQGLLDQDREIRALTRLLLSNGLPYEAAGVLEKGMTDAVVPVEKDSYELLANAFLQARDDDRALEPLIKGAEIADDALLYMVLGKVYLQSDQFEDALAALRKGLAKAKPDQRGRVYLLIGVAQLGANRLDDAERAFRSALADERSRDQADNYLKFVTQERVRLGGQGA